MPPKPIVSAEAILDAALDVTRKTGIEHVNARSLADALGCSTKPLFRLYQSMEELKQALFVKINAYCSSYLKNYAEFETDYLGVALRYIRFAKQEPNLFKALFMSNAMNHATIVKMMTDQEIEPLLDEISAAASISVQEARAVYMRMWLLSHGIASILATNSEAFELEEVQSILAESYHGFVYSIAGRGADHAASK